MAKKKTEVPKYGTITLKGIQYYRTRIMDADGKQVSLYATTCEELYKKQLEAQRQVDEIIFHRQHPTVVLGLISTFFAFCGVFMLIVGPRQNGIIALILAFLISPFGLPMAAIWLLGKVQALKFAIQDRVYG